MKLFLTSCIATCFVLSLSSFAFTPDSPVANRTMPPGASLKIQSITTVTMTTTTPDGEQHQYTVTKLECAGPAYDCAVNSAGEPVHVPPALL